MDLTVDKLEQMFQNVEVTLDCMFRRMRWEMQQQEEDGSFPFDPLLPFEELEYFQKRLAVLVAETRDIRARKQQTVAAISEKLNRTAQLARTVQNRTAVPGVTHLLPTEEQNTQDAPVPVCDVPVSRPEVPDQHHQQQQQHWSQLAAQPKDARPGRGGGAKARGTNRSSAGARGALRVRR